MRILIVDDSRSMRLILKRMLAEMGHAEVAEAEDGSVALAQMEAFRPELALVDWNMPVMNGLELIRAVRSNAEHRDIPIVMVTTETEIEQVVRALAAGASEYVMKPFTKDGILDKLDLLGIMPRS